MPLYNFEEDITPDHFLSKCSSRDKELLVHRLIKSGAIEDPYLDPFGKRDHTLIESEILCTLRSIYLNRLSLSLEDEQIIKDIAKKYEGR